MKKGLATLAQLADFDEVIDARTPAEFAEDRLPGAVSLPVLDDRQRVLVGTTYRQQSPFEARRIGGALVADNIARHLREALADKPRNWRPLVYCWRGGQRSGAFVTWLRLVGWNACQLEGGYKRWRRLVVAELERLPETLNFRVLCGPTGSAKTRVLAALARRGAQVLDLEDLAVHRGSVLGALPGRPQPAQKGFETELYCRLRAFDSGRPVFVEAESRKIGRLHLPGQLLGRMRASDCIAIDAAMDARLAYLLEDYAWLGDDPAGLQTRLSWLKGAHSNETRARWHAWAGAGALPALFAELMQLHYDPLYRRSEGRFYSGSASPQRIRTERLDGAGVDAVAEEILVRCC